MESPHPHVLEEFFLNAAAATWTGGAPETAIAELPGAKVYRYAQGNLGYIDMYCTNGPYTAGITLISADNIPVWSMSYDGWCQNDDEAVTGFLKQALMAAYQTGDFVAGRGPREFYGAGEHDGLVYHNYYDPYHWNFAFFQGSERIFRYPAHTIDLFWHRYKGGLLCGNVQQNMAMTPIPHL